MRAGLIALAVCLALPAVALASRAPSSSEAKAIKVAVTAYVKNPSNHAASENKVAKIVVSTVDSHFATASLTCVCGNSSALVGKSGSRWSVLSFGSSSDYCKAKKVPPPYNTRMTFSQYRKMLQDLNCSYAP
jgi:hypothetical protein